MIGEPDQRCEDFVERVLLSLIFAAGVKSFREKRGGTHHNLARSLYAVQTYLRVGKGWRN